jgi:hypothetical protein
MEDGGSSKFGMGMVKREAQEYGVLPSPFSIGSGLELFPTISLSAFDPFDHRYALRLRLEQNKWPGELTRQADVVEGTIRRGL